MKALGIIQLHQKKFKRLAIPEEWKGILGKIPAFFIMVIYGYTGNGKTEFCIRFAKLLTKFGKVAWLSYEQGHGSDLQDASIRNKMEEVTGKFVPIDPLENMAPNSTIFSELMAFCEKSTYKFIFIDSVDYTGLTLAQYKELKQKYGKKKSFIFIGHATKTGNPKRDITKDIIFDGSYGICVKKYMAHVEKSRYGGFEPFIIWEEKARELNPNFFN